MQRLTIERLQGFPHVQPGQDLSTLTAESLRQNAMVLEDGDVLVFAQKVISKAENRYADFVDYEATEQSREWASKCGKDPRMVQAILDEATEVLRCIPGLIIVRHKLGLVLANAGIDQSNLSETSSESTILLLPVDPDASARKLREDLSRMSGKSIGVLIIDSLGRAWRNGTSGICIGAAGVEVLRDQCGQSDLFGRVLQSTIIGVADELAAAASFAMGQAAEGTPVVLVRGTDLANGRDASARELVRPREQDLFP